MGETPEDEGLVRGVEALRTQLVSDQPPVGAPRVLLERGAAERVGLANRGQDRLGLKVSRAKAAWLGYIAGRREPG